MIYKCLYSGEYYSHYDSSFTFFSYFRGAACSNDPHFYQTCDKKIGGKITNNEVLCEHFMCRTRYFLYTSHELIKSNGFCNYDCSNTQLNKKRCIDHDVVLPSGMSARSTEVCDGNCNLGWPRACEDEAICNGYTYGIYCQHKLSKNRVKYVVPRKICDGRTDCKNGEDERNCTVAETTETYCMHISTKKLVPVHNFTRCTTVDKTNKDRLTDDRLYCRSTDMVKYQSNCSDVSRVGLICEVNGYNSSVSDLS